MPAWQSETILCFIFCFVFLNHELGKIWEALVEVSFFGSDDKTNIMRLGKGVASCNNMQEVVRY